MLRDLTRDDWLSILNIPETRIPLAVILRGTRNLKLYYQAFQQHFVNILEVGTPNSVLDDVFIGDLDGYPVAYASVYGAPMAAEIVHVFGMLGTPLAIQTGCCGALADEIATGDLFITTEAFCGEGASQYYEADVRVAASLDPRKMAAAERVKTLRLHAGRIYTTAALFAEGAREVEAWFQAGFSAVDMETATTFTVAKHFGMERASILYAFDCPRQKEHILLDDAEKNQRRQQGNRCMIEMVLDMVREYGSRRASAGASSNRDGNCSPLRGL